MEKRGIKGLFSSHSKSSALVASLVLHALLLVAALSFVAVTVVIKPRQEFVSRQVDRPKMPPKKLQVPVKIKKQQRKPKLRQRIVVKSKIQNMPEIKMPEIHGIKGGLGNIGDAGLGGAGGIGFSMPEIKLFGIRSKGEKVLLVLDAGADILRDEVGGMRAYAIIKDELVKIVEGLGPTTLFNLAVCDAGSTVMLFPQLVPATRENRAKVEAWLEPLNKVKAGMGSADYGIGTIGQGGTWLPLDGSLARGRVRGDAIKDWEYWYRPLAEAVRQNADTVFLLSGAWGHLREVKGGEWPTWDPEKKKRWEEYHSKARALQEEENRRRAARGDPPQVFPNEAVMVATYFPGEHATYGPPGPEWHYYTGEEIAESLTILRKECVANLPAVKSGITGRKQDRFSINVVFFAPKGAGSKPWGSEGFQVLAKRCDGEFRALSGLEAIENSVLKEQKEQTR